jgi:hypothetical protein
MVATIAVGIVDRICGSDHTQNIDIVVEKKSA